MATAINTKKLKKSEAGPDRVTGERTVLRQVTDTDLPVLQQWDADPAIIALMGRKFEQTDAREWLKSVSTWHGCRAWAIETLEGRLIGELELAHLNWRTGDAELRVCIGEPDCWGQGYGTDALRSALDVAFTHLGLRTVYLRVFASNARAVHVYERLGFRKQAVLQPSSRRADPSAVYLMNVTRERWYMRHHACAKLEQVN